jgi:hypothetical protein
MLEPDNESSPKEPAMSKLTLVSLLCLGAATVSATAAAQTTTPAPAPVAAAPTQETLFQHSDGRAHAVGWYLSPTSGMTSFDGRLGYVAGMRGAVVVDRTWGFGLAGSFITTNRTNFNRDEARNLAGYGGGYVQYTLRSNDLVHAFADVTAGGGTFCPQLVDDGCHDESKFGFVEPTVNVELNLFKFMRVSTGVGYRAALAGDDAVLSSRQLSGVVARSSLVFGMF